MSDSSAVKQLSMAMVFKAFLKRDLVAAFRHPSDIVNPLIFYLVVISLFPLGISPDPKFLVQIGPGVLWVGALLATLLSLEMLFQSDFQDGTLEQLVISPQPLYFCVIAKVVGHWLLSGLPLTLMSPILGLMLFLPLDGILTLFITLLLGTPVLNFIGAVGSALTVSLRKNGLLLSLLVLPLYIPVLIFASGAVQASLLGLSIIGHYALLGALLAATAVLSPLAIVAGLRISMGN